MKNKALLPILIIILVPMICSGQNFGFSNSGQGNLLLFTEGQDVSQKEEFIPRDELIKDYESKFGKDLESDLDLLGLNFDDIYEHALDSFSDSPERGHVGFFWAMGREEPRSPFGLNARHRVDSLISSSNVIEEVYQEIINDIGLDTDSYSRVGKRIVRNKVTEHISNEDVVIVADSKNKSISGTASTRVTLSEKLESKNLGGLIGISSYVKAEKDFANIFSGGEMSNSGGIGATIGFGRIPKKPTLNNDATIFSKDSIFYWLAFISVNRDFVKIANVMDPNFSLDKNTIKDKYWGGRVGINGYIPKLDLTTGVTYTFGKTNNISQLTKQKLTTTIPSISDSTLTIIKQEDVLTGTYKQLGFSNLSFDALYAPEYFKSLAVFLNFNYNKFRDTDPAEDGTYNLNIGILFRKEDKESKAYKPAFGFVMGWNNLFGDTKIKDFNFGITTTYGFGSFNKAKIPKNTEVQK